MAYKRTRWKDFTLPAVLRGGGESLKATRSVWLQSGPPSEASARRGVRALGSNEHGGTRPMWGGPQRREAVHTQPPGLLPCGLAPAVRAGQVCLHGATAEDGPGGLQGGPHSKTRALGDTASFWGALCRSTPFTKGTALQPKGRSSRRGCPPTRTPMSLPFPQNFCHTLTRLVEAFSTGVSQAERPGARSQPLPRRLPSVHPQSRTHEPHGCPKMLIRRADALTGESDGVSRVTVSTLPLHDPKGQNQILVTFPVCKAANASPK